jgi:MFS family permease
MRQMRWPGAYFWVYAAVIPYHLNEASFRILVPPYLHEIGFGLGLIGFLVALYGVAAMASRLPVGLLYRREQARFVAAGALATMGGLSFVYIVVTEPLAVAALRIAHGLVMGTAGTLHLALFLEARPPGVDRGRATALYAATTTVAYLIGNFGAGALADFFGYDVAFAMSGISVLVAAAMTLLIRFPMTARTNVPEVASTTAPSEAPQPRPGSPPAPASVPGRRTTAAVLLRNRGIRDTCLGSLVTNVLVDMTWNFVPLWGVSVGHSLTTVGAVRSAGNISGLFARALAGEVGRLTGWGVMSAGSIVILGLIIILLPTSPEIAFLFVIVSGVATIRGMQSVANNVILMEETDANPQLRGMGSAVISMSRDIGSILGPFIGGLVAATYGLDNMFRLVPIPLVLLYIPILLSEITRRRNQRALSENRSGGVPA